MDWVSAANATWSDATILFVKCIFAFFYRLIPYVLVMIVFFIVIVRPGFMSYVSERERKGAHTDSNSKAA